MEMSRDRFQESVIILSKVEIYEPLHLELHGLLYLDPSGSLINLDSRFHFAALNVGKDSAGSYSRFTREQEG